MKLTVEATPQKAIITAELNGDTFRETWVMDEDGLPHTEDDYFIKLAESTGKYDVETLLEIGDVLDHATGGFVATAAVHLAEICEGEGQGAQKQYEQI